MTGNVAYEDAVIQTEGSARQRAAPGTSMDILGLIAFFILWYVVVGIVLPRLGVPT